MVRSVQEELAARWYSRDQVERLVATAERRRYYYLCTRPCTLELASTGSDGEPDLYQAEDGDGDIDRATWLALPRRLHSSYLHGSGLRGAPCFEESSREDLLELGLMGRAESPDLHASCYAAEE